MWRVKINMMTNESLQTLLTFILLGSSIVLISALQTRKRTHSHADYLVGGRSANKFLVGLSVAAAANSGAVMIASVGLGYTQGLAALLFPIGYLIGDLTFWLFFPERANRVARERNCFTVPELLSSPFSGERRDLIRKVATILMVIVIGLFGAAQFYAAGVALSSVFDVGFITAIAISGLIIVGYSAIGGVQSSVFVGSFMAIIMLLGATGVLASAIFHSGGVINTINALSSINPGLVSISSSYTVIGTIGVLAGFAFSGLGFGLSGPHLLVRFFSGKNQQEVKSARWFYLGATYTIWCSTTLLGSVCRVLFSEIDDPEQALLTYAVHYFDPWIVGFVVFMVFGAIASTADSQLLVFSSAIGVDLLPKIYDRMTLKFGNWYRVLLTVCCAILFAVLASQFNQLIGLMFFITALMPATFAVAMLVILLELRTTIKAILCTMASGFLVSLLWSYLGFNQLINGALPGILVSLLVHFIVVNVTPISGLDKVTGETSN